MDESDFHPDRNPRDSHVGLEFNVAIRLERRRGNTTDVIEQRLTTMAIAVIAAFILILVAINVFQLIAHIFSR